MLAHVTAGTLSNISRPNRWHFLIPKKLRWAILASPVANKQHSYTYMHASILYPVHHTIKSRHSNTIVKVISYILYRHRLTRHRHTTHIYTHEVKTSYSCFMLVARCISYCSQTHTSPGHGSPDIKSCQAHQV